MAEASPGARDPPKELGINGRAAYSSLLWFGNDGKRLPITYAYDNGFSEQDMFEKVITFWSENTCLIFNKEPNSRCALKPSRPAISLYSRGYVTEHRGIQKDKPCTVMSLGGGYWSIVNTLLMNVLGMMSYTYRNDSSQYISMNIENFDPPSSVYKQRAFRTQLSSYHRCHGHTQVLPTPFDYMSKQMPFSYEFGSLIETTPVYVTLDPRHQYLLDYSSAAALAPTFYDILTINTMYKCPAEWASECKTAVPKCKNNGYISKGCTCLCSPGFSGATCGTKNGPLFPLQQAAFEVTITADKTYDFSSLNIQTADVADADYNFRYYVFVNIRIAPKDPNLLPSITLLLPFAELGKTLAPLATKLIRYLGTADCIAGMRLLWGSGRRLACDCVSSLATNETAENARVFRGREPDMTMALINNWGRTFRKQELTVQSSQFQLTAEFRRRPAFSLAETPGDLPVPVNVNGSSGGGDGGGGGGGGSSGGGGGSTTAEGLISATGAAGALTASDGSGPGIGLLVAAGLLLLLLLLLLGLLLLFLHKRRKKEEVVEEHEEGDGSDSESTDSDDHHCALI